MKIAHSNRRCQLHNGTLVYSEPRPSAAHGAAVRAGCLTSTDTERHAIGVLAYVAGIIASAVPLLPGGFGAVEAAIPAVLHAFGAPLDAALGGTLVYRGISALLPAAAGAMLLIQTWLGRHRPLGAGGVADRDTLSSLARLRRR